LFSGLSKQKKKRNRKRFTAEIEYKLLQFWCIKSNIWLWMAENIIIMYLTENGLSPGGSGYYVCT